MAKPRIFIEEDSEAGVYHALSRAVDGNDIFADAEKETFVRMMRAAAAFHQVEILTFCVMSNHFHIVMKVPQRPDAFDLPLEMARLSSKPGGSACSTGCSGSPNS